MRSLTTVDTTQPIIATVRPADGQNEEWVVGPADGLRPGRTERFAGFNALTRALTFAHEEYDGVRWSFDYEPLPNEPLPSKEQRPNW
jgi:hypothetical protein